MAGVLGGMALAMTAGAPAQAALETVLQDDGTLLYRPPAQVRASMKRIHQLGVDRVRLTANWAVLTRGGDDRDPPASFDARDPAAYEQARWRGLDQAVRLAHAAGLKVLIDIGFHAPHWATSDPTAERDRTDVSAADFADFAVAVALRYSGSFVPPSDTEPPSPPTQEQTFLDKLLGGSDPVTAPAPPAGRPLPAVDQFALWNEPNHPAFLMPQWTGAGRAERPASPVLYGRMVRMAYPAAKAVRPDATFLIGNTSSIGARTHQAVGPLRFIRELACVDARLRPRTTGACANFSALPGDGWAHHPYTRNLRPDLRPDPTRRDNVPIAALGRMSRLLRRLVAMGRLAPGLAQIHLTEFGYETHRIGHRPALSLGTQARWLTWAEYLSSRVPGVVSFAQFLLRDQLPGKVRVSASKSRAFGQYYTGLLTAGGADKPAARSFTAGLFAQWRPRGRVLLWARLRLGPGLRRIAIEERRRGGRWQRLLAASVGGQDSFQRIVAAAPGTRYRLRWPTRRGTMATGLTITPVR